ncbi:MAG: hypothetical protein E7461_02245 [Ruminococcaceae bacterium]|nr:hypothetical protein [Oscillospiraceae bacterium]
MNKNEKIVGVWHRPNVSGKETDLVSLCAVLDRFRSAGINTVFLETFYHGKTVFRTDKVRYNDTVASFVYGDYPDYATAFVVEAEKRGIGVHAWVQDFYIGVDEKTPLVTDHEDWLLTNQRGSIRHTTEGQGFGGYIFLDPANPEVGTFLTDFYDELLTKLPAIKGLNLDYIRYPVSVFEENTDTGYTRIAMESFAEKNGLTIKADDSREAFRRQIEEKGLEDAWTFHRSEYVTAFVRQVRQMVSSKHPGKLISTAVFPEVEQTYQLKKQNFRVWVDSGYIDIVTPMVYFYEASQIRDAVERLKAICSSARCCTGLYTTYHNQSTEALAEHIAASDKAGADGVVFFDSAKTFFQASEDYTAYLSAVFGESKNV